MLFGSKTSFRSSKMFKLLFLFIIASLATSLKVPSVLAQMTTATLRGQVIAGQQGEANVEVVLTHKPSGISRQVLTNEGGEFIFTSLKVGGPYELGASLEGSGVASKADLFLNAGNNDRVVLKLEQAEVVQVLASRMVKTQRASSFGEEDIRNAPTTDGDLKDVIRNSADVYLDGSALVIGGANNRFNSITVDGIRQDDDFGLNSNGYPTQRSPISLQSVAEITVNRSPFDVRYSNFLGGNVNVVTKSGGNEYEGSVLLSYGSDGLTGSKSKDSEYEADFEETRLGLALGGPIVKDELHFFLNAEVLEASTPNVVGPAGSGQPVEVERVTAEDVARAKQIAKEVYGFEAGDSGRKLTEDDMKLLAKLDWKINEDHRLETIYQKSTGSNINSGNSNDFNLSLTSNWYKKRDTLDTLSLRLFSDWSYDFSTKLEVSRKQVKTDQVPLNGRDFMQAEIETEDEGTIILGPDSFRHANELKNTSTYVGFESNYLLGDHEIVAGVNHNVIDVFNLFVPNSNGSASYVSLDAFEAKQAENIFYQNAISNNPKDAAANWDYSVSSVFLQDSFQPLQGLTARYGVRAEIYGASENIDLNENFLNRYGFANDSTIAGKQVFLPRFELNYQASNRLSVRGGFGLYSGGTPNVWISNNYTNTGFSTDTAFADDVEGFDGRNIPEILSSQLRAGDGNVDALDPDFEIPQSWKFSMGSNYSFDVADWLEDVLVEVDYSYSKVRHGLVWKDLRRNSDAFENNQPTAVGPDGRDLYNTTPSANDETNFDPRRGYDMLLTNTDQGYSHTAFLSLSKYFSQGFNLRASYGWQKIREVHPGTSSIAASNYGNIAIGKDPNNPDLARSNYEREHRFVVSAGYTEKLLSTLESSFQLFFERRSGQPYSYTFGGDRDVLGGLFGESRDFARRERMLFYVPKGDGSDVTLDGIDEGEFNAFLDKSGLAKYRGKIAPRNAFTSDWMDRVDLRIAQQLPAFSSKHRARLTFDIRNLPNLLNNKWGQVRQAGFPYYTPVVDVDYDAESGKYIYSNLNSNDANRVRLGSSIWRLQLGAVYEF